MMKVKKYDSFGNCTEHNVNNCFECPFYNKYGYDAEYVGWVRGATCEAGSFSVADSDFDKLCNEIESSIHSGCKLLEENIKKDEVERKQRKKEMADKIAKLELEKRAIMKTIEWIVSEKDKYVECVYMQDAYNKVHNMLLVRHDEINDELRNIE